jgi:hypothetical protein
MLSAMFAKLIQFKALLDCFLVFMTAVADCFAFNALELDHVVL